MGSERHSRVAATRELVGRDLEIALLLHHYKRVASSMSSVLLVRGEGGIGKSRLMAEVVGQATALGALTMRGHATPFDAGIPYAVVRETLASLPVDLPSDAARAAEEFRRLLDLDQVPDTAINQRPAILGAALSLIGCLAEIAPVVVVWEDLHVADADSVRLFMLLARQLTRTRTLLIGSLRPNANSTTGDLEQLVEHFAAEDRGAVVDLAPLDRSEVHSMVSGLIGVTPDRAVVDLVFDASRGNPFFATETVRSLMSSSSIVIGETRGHLTARRQVLLNKNTSLIHRFFRVGTVEMNAAKVLSAFGRISLRHLPLVASIADLPQDRVADSFDRLVANQLLVRLGDGRYEFTHSILREALYDDIGPAEQRRIHQLIAKELAHERRDGIPLDIIELATHAAKSANVGDHTAASVLTQAGQMTASTAPLASALWFSKAVALLPEDSPEQTAVLALEARALVRSSRPQEAAIVGRRALEHMASGPARTRTLADTVNSLYICGDLDGAIAVIDDEERRNGPVGHPLLAQRSHFRAQFGRADPDHERSAVDPTAADLHPAALVITLTHQLHLSTLRGNGAVAHRLIDQLEACSRGATRQAQLEIHSTLALAETTIGRLDRARRNLAAADHLRRSDRALSISGNLKAANAKLAFLSGRWDDALEAARNASWEIDEPNHADILSGLVRTVECDIHIERGQLREASELAEGLTWKIEHVRPFVDATRAKVRLALGDLAGARTILEAAHTHAHRYGLAGFLEHVLVLLIRVRLAVAEKHTADEHLAELDALARSTASPTVSCRALLARALVHGDVDAARAAVQTADDLGMDFERARAQLVSGSMGFDPQNLLTKAYITFDELGAVPSRQQAAAELRARHLTVPRHPSDPKSALSATESQLVRFVCDGMTNRLIAATMHYSPKTVEVYLSRVYSKTGCHSRLELARAVDRGLVTLAR